MKLNLIVPNHIVDHLLLITPDDPCAPRPSADENGVYLPTAFDGFTFERIDVKDCPLKVYSRNYPNAGGFSIYIELWRENDNPLGRKLNNRSDFGFLVPMQDYYIAVFSEYFDTECAITTYPERGKINDYFFIRTTIATPCCTWKDENHIVESKI